MDKTVLLSQKFSIRGDEVFDPANISARDFRNVSFFVIADLQGLDSISVRCLGSYQDTPPDFSSPSIDGNEWHYIQLKDVNTSAYEDGDDGIVITADGTYARELNTDGQTWVTLEVFNFGGGGIIPVLVEPAGVAQFLFRDNT